VSALSLRDSVAGSLASATCHNASSTQIAKGPAHTRPAGRALISRPGFG
jgi:hypothetical protein